MRRAALVGIAGSLVLAVGASTAIRVEGASDAVSERRPAAPLLPDLVVRPLTDLVLAWKDGGRESVFFTASIANVGKGPFVVRAVRRRGGPWRLTQRFSERDGSTSERAVPGTLVFGGHGHNHWHVRLGASYRLVSGGRVVRRLVKAGFCFFDHSPLPGFPASGRPHFSSSGCNGPGSLRVDMGISAGWYDPYTWLLPDQRIDVTGLPDGRYRLVAEADPDGWFAESDESDNAAWVDFTLSRDAEAVRRLRVTGRSPDATRGVRARG